MKYLDQNDQLLVFIGPSASGKSAAIKILHDQGLIAVTPSWTTRPPRPAEVEEALEHVFVSEEGYQEKKRSGFFLESVQMFGLPYSYGIPKVAKPEAGKAAAIMMRASTIPLVQNHYPNFVIYQIEDELEKVKTRLEARLGHGEQMGSRLEDYKSERDSGRELAHRVFENTSDLQRLVDQIQDSLYSDGLAHRL